MQAPNLNLFFDTHEVVIYGDAATLWLLVTLVIALGAVSFLSRSLRDGLYLRVG